MHLPTYTCAGTYMKDIWGLATGKTHTQKQSSSVSISQRHAPLMHLMEHDLTTRLVDTAPRAYQNESIATLTRWLYETL